MLGSAAMEAEPPAAAAQAAARSSILDSIRGCGLAGMRIDKEELRRMILMPDYLRVAMAMAVRTKDWNAGVTSATSTANRNSGDQAMPEAPMVVFVNSRSGGRHGPALKVRLQELMSEEQVFDLSAVKPSDVVQYGLTCLEKLADLGNNCAKATRAKLRVIVAGGDGTVGWVLGALAELFVQKREPIPPTGIIPLGTGNDLSRSFDWGGSFPFAWRSAVKSTLYKAVTGPVCRLDRAVVKRLQRPKSRFSENGFWEFLDARIEQDGEDPLKPATIKRWKGRVIPHVASPLPDFNPGLQDWKGRTMGFSSNLERKEEIPHEISLPTRLSTWFAQGGKEGSRWPSTER